MKKIAALMAGAAAFCAFGTYALADNIYVTISTGDGGDFMVSQIDVSDTDGDGKLTVNDALYTAHEEFFDGGADAGYAAERGDYGLMLTKLWGVENGGSYGYYVNNTAAMSLEDEIKEGDTVDAFAYTDLENWSDVYCWFENRTENLVIDKKGEEAKLALTVSGIGYDENWNPVTVPIVGAAIAIDGSRTGAVTDENGKAEVSFTEGGAFEVRAFSDTQTLVEPICLVTVDVNPDTSGESDVIEYSGEDTEDEDTAAAEIDVYVAIADADGKLALAGEAVTASDRDLDGRITIDEALYAAHEQFYDGGAEAGYASEVGDYGLMLTKLWGTENGGSYGYYVDNASAMSLDDELNGGENVYAFVYTDLENWSDTYCWFETVDGGTLQLLSASFDENWSPITVPVAGASIIVDGEKTDLITDEDGKVIIEGIGGGNHLISAVSDTQTLVPPVLNVSVIAPVKVEEAAEPVAEPIEEPVAEPMSETAQTEAPTAGDVSAAVTSAKASPDTGIEDIAAIAGIAVLAIGAIAVGKKKH